MSELKYWLGFNLVKGVGSSKLNALLTHFGDIEHAWHAHEQELVKIGFDRRARKNLIEARQTLDLDAELARVQETGARLICWESSEYPDYLREIDGAPPLLYLQGSIEDIDRWAVAVVGTRRVTAYGRQVTQEIVGEMVRNGVTIVSGLARGVDAVAHRTALEFGGRTLAVLGSGLDEVYPAEHRKLAQEIGNGRGAIITEYALGVRPEARNFPPRNRIISGLSLGVIVVEAGERSGALITTRFALEQNRDVFAVPGNINSPASKGPNRLIQDGAKLVTSAKDVLEELNVKQVLEKTAVQLALPESAEEAALLAHLSGQPIHADELSRLTELPSKTVSGTLALMELKGVVRHVGGMNYVLSR